MSTRRHCLKAVGAAFAASQLPAQVSSKADASKLAMPGLYRGRVVAVHNKAAIVSGQFQREPIRQMIRKGMAELTQTDGGADAWRQFFGPGDVVGVKLNPVGQPHVMSSPEVVREIIAGLNSAGVKAKEIVVYDRYRKQFYTAGFDKWLPEGVRIANAAEDYQEIQMAIEGYDPDHYMDMALTMPGYDVNNLTARRSYAAQFI